MEDNTFSNEVRESMLGAFNGYCQCSESCVMKATEFHHILPNTKMNQKLYPLFLQSPFNCCPINRDCHSSKPKVKIRENLVIVYEEYLNKLKNSKPDADFLVGLDIQRGEI